MNNINYLVIFFISLLSLALELFLTRILNLKTWNHLVYIIIPFAMLGYGIGANLYLILKEKIAEFAPSRVIASLLLALSAAAVLSALAIIELPIRLDDVEQLLTNQQSIVRLLEAYTIVLVPFSFIGFLTVYFFATYPKENHKLYFADLVGAGVGAFLFFIMIQKFSVIPSLIVLAGACVCLALNLLLPKFNVILPVLLLSGLILNLPNLPEPQNYNIDPKKGWEWIPGYYKEHQYKNIVNQWSPLGRTEIFQILDPKLRDQMLTNAFFKISVAPVPELSYSVTNYVAGTPIFRLEEKALQKAGSQVMPFSQPFEAPYTLLKEPKVVIIGTGGGRDIFTAEVHQAKSVTGAEFNPVMYKAMSKLGAYFDYSGKLYGLPNVSVFNLDGRHLVKRLPSGQYDLLLLTGVDTFSGLSTGAYTYAESYLYTSNAVVDYLRVLKNTGILNFNRRYFPDMPREDLRLMTLSLDGLRTIGAKEPLKHIIMGSYQQWIIILVKKTPFTEEELSGVKTYFSGHETQLLYPTGSKVTADGKKNYFEIYAQAFEKGIEKRFWDKYPYDVSVVSDDNPFFYKYYKFKSFNPFNLEMAHYTGTIIFMTQLIVLSQACLFIVLFIFLPLFVLKRQSLNVFATETLLYFVAFFSCVGLGFMFVEIPLIQKFVLLLGSPIHSLSVTLPALLIASGCGSWLLTLSAEDKNARLGIIQASGVFFALYTLLFIIGGEIIINSLMHLSFPARAAATIIMLFPFGLCLGAFFPAGLELIGKNYPQTIPWAWGINCGLSVLSSILSIILAQFCGFTVILLLALVIYGLAIVTYGQLQKIAV